jgi:WD40 repeat protein
LQDRRLASLWWDFTLRIWDLESHRFDTTQYDGRAEPSRFQLGRMPADLDVSPDGKCLAHVGSRDHKISLWDVDNGQELTSAATARLNATGVRFSPDNRFLAVSHTDGLELFRPGEWQRPHSVRKGERLDQPRFSSRGSRLAAVREGREIVVWDLTDLEANPAVFSHDIDIRGVAFSPDSRYVASSSAAGTVHVWDVIRREPFGATLPGVLAEFSADGTQLLCLANERGEHGVWLWDLSRVRDHPLALPALTEGRTLAASRDQSITAEIAGQGIVLQTPTGRSLLFAPARVSLHRVGFDASDQYLIAEGADARVWVWDVRTGTLLQPPRQARYEVSLTLAHLSDPTPGLWDRNSLPEVAALLAGQRPDRTGGMMPLDEAKRARLLGALRRVHPGNFTVMEVDRARWHREQAEAAEQAMSWDSAVFHWERVRARESELRNPKSGIGVESRLFYARQAGEEVQKAVAAGRSRWSVRLPRPTWATPEMLDLGAAYTRGLGESLVAAQPSGPFRALASGVRDLAGTRFDVRGILELSHTNSVTIPVGKACRRIHFLQAASRAVPNIVNRERLGRYQVTYANGQKLEVMLWNPADVPPYSTGGYFSSSSNQWPGTVSELRGSLAWSGVHSGLVQRKEPVFLTRTTWELPGDRQTQMVEKLELQAESAGSVPLVFAITIE